MDTRQQVEQELDRPEIDPDVRNELRKVVEEVSQYVPGTKTKGMMYDLVHVILAMDQRIRSLEARVCYGDVRKELKRQKWARTYPL